MSEIRLRNLVKKFGSFTALKSMDLRIGDGEFMALLGPSGCGKSTTMNMIAGMEDPTEGSILFGERDMARVPMGKRGNSYLQMMAIKKRAIAPTNPAAPTARH